MGSDCEALAAFYARYLARCNEHRFDDLGEFVAADVNGPTEGLAKYAAGLRAVADAFPDYRWDLTHLLVDGDWLSARLYGSGTHTGQFEDVKATRRAIRTQELVIYRVADAKIAQCWGDLGSVVRNELLSPLPAKPDTEAQ